MNLAENYKRLFKESLNESILKEDRFEDRFEDVADTETLKTFQTTLMDIWHDAHADGFEAEDVARYVLQYIKKNTKAPL